MNCISDKIIARFESLPEIFREVYAQYKVDIKQASTPDDYVTIFNGRVFCINDNVDIYLNDIITPYLYPFTDIKVTLTYEDQVVDLILDPVINVYLPPYMTKLTTYANKISLVESAISNELAHYPINCVGLNVGCMVAVTSSNLSYKIKFPSAAESPQGSGGVYKVLKETTNEEMTNTAGLILAYGGDNSIAFASIDDCCADYYLNWIDRCGAWTCQPFSKKVVYSQDITTTTLYDVYETEKISKKSITPKWKLNTDWLTEDQYKAYESILVSPQIKLYETSTGNIYDVICKGSSWEKKTKKNNKRLFNLTIDVQRTDKQVITY